MLEERWEEEQAAGLSGPELLLYRSNLLGSDLQITNFGGGNTSAKLEQSDPLTGEPTRVLWVKGSGGDLGSMDLSGFAALYQEKLLALERLYRGPEHEDEMVEYLTYCSFGSNRRAASIDTPLHAFLPHRHIDHMHPDGLIAIAAARSSEELTREVFGEALTWVPWQRPGFGLALKLRDAVRERPDCQGIVLAGHGLFTWGESARECYRNTLQVIRRAARWLEEHNTAPAFGGLRQAALPQERREAEGARLMPLLRGKIGGAPPKVGHFDDREAVLEFCGSQRLQELAALGTSCPDHFLRTKIRPLVLGGDLDRVEADIDDALARYRDEYEGYYHRCRRPDSPPMRDPHPVVYLVPGVGMFTFAKDKATARVAAEFYVNAIHVMRGAAGVDEYVGLPEQEAFDIEYWALEEAKLRRMPPPEELAGRIAYVTGGAGGIGRAVARRLVAGDASVVLVDIDAEALEAAQTELRAEFGADGVLAVQADVTDEESVVNSFRTAARAYGGLDIVVSNAGIASSAPVEETSLELWHRNFEVLATGYFLVSREAMRLLKRQGLGGSIVFVASKNALVASPGAAAYSTAKSAELHLARCLALEGAPQGIRVNVVNPDAVLRGSRIWSGAWRAERAEAYGVEPGELEEHYRERSLLKRSVYPEDVAEAVHFFASERSGKSTGNILNVDAGNATAFTR
jgi:rhamnulose-1-phosphate aldolase/alcohol dehydrogenase